MSLRRVVGVWALLAVLMSGNGILREVALVPWLARPAADAVSAALGIAIILATTRALVRGGPGWSRGRVAVIWVGLTIAFECVVGRYVDGKEWRELLENYALWRGRLWPLVLASLAAAPYVWTRDARGREDAPAPRALTPPGGAPSPARRRAPDVGAA
ncbi:hypothetical protein [Roseisolibacter sp. H3M3-2]|uniref:hypothetical protein n=1 Tax=Roseisolibacter sp. H3M3-2 TaxID=3031323 RepID=UPI0023DA75F5|nr:hypothetical protein [Roseisolibacter sp. H3M3-2]MDF1506084.1 hypothetical protein [Roseisolibacter sp. H3M3-2]